jgi:LmbE family N-acetylglucosaminyl deacetylase
MMDHNIVIVSAHPDDMEIGMGGTAAKLADLHGAIISVIITNGGRASNPFGWTEQRMAETRREEALRSARVLGVKEVIFLDQPDAVEEINIDTVKETLVELLLRLQPAEVYTLDEELDRHPAHRLARPPASGPMKSGARLRPGTGWNISTTMWRKRCWRLPSIAARWPRSPMEKACWD